MTDAGTRPDFLYDDDHVAIYVDGPHHEYPHRAERDHDAEDRLFAHGWSVLRFGLRDDWAAEDRRTPRDLREGQRVTFAPGSLVRARDREWIVLPDSTDDLLRAAPARRRRRRDRGRPRRSRGRRASHVRLARSRRRRRSPFGAPIARRGAARVPLIGRTIPFLRSHRGRASALPARPAAHGAATRPGPAPHRRRRRNRQDHRGGTHR